MKYLFSFLLIALLTLHSFSQVKATIGTQEEDVYPLSLSPDVNDALLPLKKTFSEKEIVGMGEATHGTKEFFELKSQTFKFLVTNCNFKVFGIEASAGGCSYINDYITTGVGNIDTVMRYFDFWVWRTEEVKELVLWIQNYNQQKSDPEKISFYGFDMQNIYSPLKYISDNLKLSSPSQYNQLIAIVNPVLTKSDQRIKGLLRDPSSKINDTLSSINVSLQKWLTDNKTLLETNYSAKQINRLFLCSESYSQSLKGLQINTQYRDSCMAYNILKIQQLENSKMFIWAHNEHININLPSDNDIKYMGRPMGSYIKNTLGDNYYSIGFVFNQGSFRARECPKTIFGVIAFNIFSKKKMYDIKDCQLPVNKKNTLTNAFALSSQTALFIDLRNSSNPVFSTTQLRYECGANLFYNSCSVEIIAKRQFDGLIYIDKTNNAVAIK